MCMRARACVCVLACVRVTLLLIISMFFTAYIRYLQNLMMNDYIQKNKLQNADVMIGKDELQ